MANKKIDKSDKEVLDLMEDILENDEGLEEVEGDDREFVQFEIDEDGESHTILEPGNTKEFLDKNSDEELEVELVDDEEAAPAEDKPEAPVVADKKEEKPKEVKERDSRAQERIRELAREAKEAKQAAEEERRRSEELRIGYAKRESERLKTEIEVYEARMKEAMQEQDPEAFVAAQKALNQAQVGKSQLDRFLEETGKAAPQQKPGKVTEDDIKNKKELPEAAQDWLGSRNWMDINEYKQLSLAARKKVYPVRQAAISETNALIREGFDPEDPSFFEELDMRLGSRFDYYEDLALLGADALESDVEEKKPHASGETLKPRQKQEQKIKNVPVSASSASSPSKKTSKSPMRIKVTQGQKDFFYNTDLCKEMTWEAYVKLIQEDQTNNEGER